MTGDGTTRFCKHCQLHVHNLSNMTRAEAESFLSTAEGRVCAAFWRRADGTILTTDCPVGAAEVRASRFRRLRGVAALIGICISTVAGFALGPTRWESFRGRLSEIAPFSTVGTWLGAPPPSRFIMGSLF